MTQSTPSPKTNIELFSEDQAKAFEQLRQQHTLLPPKVPAFYMKKVEAEVTALQHKNGPLYKVVFPTDEKIQVRAPGEVKDYIDDRLHIPNGTRGHFLHKYRNRVLFMPTSVCLGHCMYCFRQDMLEEQHEHRQKALSADVEELINYLKEHPEISEVILSGGDPMMLPTDDLSFICEELNSVKSVKDFRIHTRAPIFDPKVMTPSKIELLIKNRFRFVIHAVHPYELCEEVLKALTQAHKDGLRLYNQFPLLRGVNDHPEVLIQLFRTCDEHHINNLSVFLPEPIIHSAAYRIPFKRIYEIIHTVQNNMPAWLHSTRFCQDTPVGKVRLDQRVASDQTNQVCFEKDGKKVTIPDFPESLDQKGTLKNLLWKESF